MSGELEAAGAAATAGLAAGVIEGREGSRRHGEGKCLNCGAELAGGRFCGECGQNAHVHRTLGHVFEEFLHGVLHFDTKAWRTLPMLAFRPGTLTHDYIHGKRARYVSPLAMFLFTIFLMFFVFSLAMPQNAIQLDEGNLRALSRTQLEQRLRTARQAESELATERARHDVSAPDAAAAAAGLDMGRRTMERRRVAIEAEIARRDGRPPPAGAEAPTEGEGSSLSVALRNLAEDENTVFFDGADELNAKLREKLRNPELLLYKIQQNAYKFSFLLAPISLPFVALLFLWKRGWTLYDHVVFTLYSLSFMSLLFIGVSLLALGGSWTDWAIEWLVMLGIPAHMFFQLGGTYRLGVWSALWRTTLLLFFAMIALTLFIVLMFVFGVLG